MTTAYQRLLAYSASHRYPGTTAVLARAVGLGYGATCKALRRQPLCGWVAAKPPPPVPVPVPPPTSPAPPSPEVEFRRKVEQATPDERAALFAEARRRRWDE